MKINVYAICKNESKFVDRWVDSMQEADGIYVLDTGSTDDTVNKLQKRKVNVTIKEINPWRFDVARNESLKLLPKDTDICVCTDLDEVFEKGWREKLESAWQKDTTRASYLYNWSFDKYNQPATTFYLNQIHTLKDYTWTHPVHEVLTTTKEEKQIVVPGMVLNHYPDLTKSRGSYLPLLELSVKEDPLDDRNMHYLGREYMYYQRWNDCIDTLIKHLDLKTATWKDERAASMRFIARSYLNLKRINEAIMWYEMAINEAPYLREAYVELAQTYYNLANYDKAYFYVSAALEIKEKSDSYINEEFCWNASIYDLKALSSYNLGKIPEAIYYEKLALELDPDNERLKNNLEIMQNVK